MFREDFEFHDETTPSHLGHGYAPRAANDEAAPSPAPVSSEVCWSVEAEKELRKVPFFVRGKARRNTERFAKEKGFPTITIETLYDAKAHYAR